MKITFKQFRAMTIRELSDILSEAEREYEARNHDLGGHRFVHDKDVTDSEIILLLENERRGTKKWYVLNREKYGRAK